MEVIISNVKDCKKFRNKKDYRKCSKIKSYKKFKKKKITNLEPINLAQKTGYNGA